MTIKEIADRLVQLCARGQFETALTELFADTAVSIEPVKTPGFDKETHGLPAILEKTRKFDSLLDTIHTLEVSPPILAEHSFAVSLHMVMTMKDGSYADMTELCLYRVADGKIVSEEFIL